MTDIAARPGPPRPDRSAALAPIQCTHLAAALGDLDPNWSIELHHDVHGDAMIVVMPDDPDDAVLPTLIMHRDETVYRLEELCGDSYANLGDYRAWPAVMRAVRIRLIWAAARRTRLH